MGIINAGGYSWRQCQSEGEWRLKQCFEFSGRFLTDSANPAIPAAYKSCSDAKLYEWSRCVAIAHQVGCAEYPVVISRSSNFFTVGFFTTDPENGNINRVFWITPSHKYYADV